MKSRSPDSALCLALAFVALASPFARAAKPLPPSPSSYVYNEGVVSASAEQAILSRLSQVEARTGHQFVVALFQSLGEESLEDYVNRLFRAWKIGDQKRNDGLLFCLFLKERRWRVEVGYGLEGTLTDLEAAEIVRTRGVPAFKVGNVDQGVSDTVNALSSKIGGGEVPRFHGVPTRDVSPRSRPNLEYIWYFLLAFYVIFWVAYENGFHWGMDDWTIGRRAGAEPRYPTRALFILGLYLLFLLRWGFDLLRIAALFRGGGGGFSGGGGSSGGGGASGSW